LIRQWSSKVAEAAKEVPPGASPFGARPAGDTGDTGDTDADDTADTALILSAAEFIAGFTPPNYLVDGILQRGYLYSLTARTGHGKTAVSMFLMQAIARGTTVKGHPVLQGSVLMLAGENPDDIRARFLTLAAHHGFDATSIEFHFIAGVVNIEAELPRIRDEVARIGEIRLVVVDTAGAYYVGDEGNSNVQQGAFARVLRQLTFLPGKPTVVVPCHPVKHAAKDNLLPVGGGAFVNEVDGNLTLWSEAEGQTTMHWQGKFRGPEFEPIVFRISPATADTVKDDKGRLMPSVVAEPMSEIEAEAGEREQESKENQVLGVIAADNRLSFSHVARRLKWLSPTTGEPMKAKVHRLIGRLVDDKLLVRTRGGRYAITPKGKREIGLNDDDE
jgi:hypothetical protein